MISSSTNGFVSDVYDRPLAKVCISQAGLCLFQGVLILAFVKRQLISSSNIANVPDINKFPFQEPSTKLWFFYALVKRALLYGNEVGPIKMIGPWKHMILDTMRISQSILPKVQRIMRGQ